MKTTFWKLIEEDHNPKIIIPIIQRDYAQGRNDKKTNSIREVLLEAIKVAIDHKSSLDFDFVYGNVSDGALYPLDGQQRLTTLFLLHWYFSVKAQLDNKESLENKEILKKFSYQTRVSSQRFCEQLVCSTLQHNKVPISKEIKNQSWFALTWNNDPTIVAMLNMLDAIELEFKSYDTNSFQEGFKALKEQDIIHFQYLDMNLNGLSDDLYIKMNARGKALTDFENFKARFEKKLDDKTEFAKKVDGVWTEMFWKEMSDGMDVGFMRYFDYIAEIGSYIYPQGGEERNENDIDFKLRVFKDKEVLDLLFNSLDEWCGIKDKATYFNGYFTEMKYEEGKVPLYDKKTNLFERCLNAERFDYKAKLMLYAVILQRINKREQKKELRLIRNLLVNSEDEICANNMHKMFRSIKSIMNVKIDKIIDIDVFNGPQVEDEKVKADFIHKHPGLAEVLYHFEDHYILKGRMSAIELDSSTLEQHRESFYKLFEKDGNLISRAVLCFGDYSHEIGNKWRFANSANSWSYIFTTNNVVKIKKSLNLLLVALQDKEIEDIIKGKLDEFEVSDSSYLPWIYYFIKYSEMNVGESARYVWHSEFNVRMLNKTSLNGYWRDPYLWSVYSQFSEDERKRIIETKHIFNQGGNPKEPTIEISGIELSMHEKGWSVKLNSTNDAEKSVYDELCKKYEISDGVINTPKNVDRIELGVKLIKDILSYTH